MIKVNFLKSIKVFPDKEKEKLLRIQDEIEKNDITPKNVFELTKNLSDSQKSLLKQLYIEQIENLNNSVEKYKKKILKIKANMQRLKKID